MIWPGVRAIFSEDPHCPNALLISKTNVYFVCTCYLIVFIYEIKPKHANLLYCCSVAPPQFSSFEKKVIQRRTKESKGTEKNEFNLFFLCQNITLIKLLMIQINIWMCGSDAFK